MKLTEPKQKQNNEILKYLVIITQLGFIAAFSILFFFLLFLFLDRKFHSGGILLLFGIILGIISAFWSSYRFLKKVLKY
ncbi:MAG: AtpZ/AtpI family protein [Candidatus Cloacimonetes bacterium]|nr:AtpZ/AtpI family protein [Candidatus Cloacimonadota bacterium]